MRPNIPFVWISEYYQTSYTPTWPISHSVSPTSQAYSSGGKKATLLSTGLPLPSVSLSGSIDVEAVQGRSFSGILDDKWRDIFLTQHLLAALSTFQKLTIHAEGVKWRRECRYLGTFVCLDTNFGDLGQLDIGENTNSLVSHTHKHSQPRILWPGTAILANAFISHNTYIVKLIPNQNKRREREREKEKQEENLS